MFLCAIILGDIWAEKIWLKILFLRRFLISGTKREKIDIRTSLKSYLFQAVCKNSLYYLRKAKKEEMLEDYLVKHPTDNMGMDKFTADSPSDFLLMKDLSEKIQAGIDRLPPQQQTTFKLKRYEGKKNREIAEIMGLSVKTVEMHLAKAMLSLRTYLKIISLNF
jgi:RNA polymerase sigma-70 factor, ECF subfamily